MVAWVVLVWITKVETTEKHCYQMRSLLKVKMNIKCQRSLTQQRT